MRRALAILLIGAAVAIGACGNSEETPTSAGAPVAHETKAPNWTALEKAAGRDSSRLTIPSGPPPKKLVINDLRIGNGRRLDPGHEFRVKYIALEYDSGVVIQEAWKPPFSASFRRHELVKAFEIGLEGMRVGGVRELIAPSALAYKEGALVYLARLVWVGRKY